MRLSAFFMAAAATAAIAFTSSAQPSSSQPRVIARIALPDGGWDLASFDPVRRRIYLARNNAVTAIEVDSGKVIGKLSPAQKGHAVVPLNHGAEILVTNGDANTADIFDAMTGAPLASIKTGQKPDAALYDDATGLAVVMNGHSGDLTLIDPRTRKAVGLIVIGGGLELGAGDGQGTLFVNVEDHNQVAVVDLRTRKVVRRIALSGCEGPTGIAYLAASRRTLSSCANGVAVVADPATGKAERTFPIGQGPDTVIYDPQRRIAAIPAGRSGELDLFVDDASGVHPAGKVITQSGAKTGVVDPQTGRIYLPAAQYGPAPSPGEHGPVKPGSVVLLVVEPAVGR